MNWTGPAAAGWTFSPTRWCPPLTTALTRLLALLMAAVLTGGPHHAGLAPHQRGAHRLRVHRRKLCAGLSAVHGAGAALGILAAAAAYQFTRRADLSMVLFVAFCALSLTVWADDWQLCWLNPCVWALSDDFSNFRVFRSVAWMRLTWLAALAGVWTVSYLCIRQYGEGHLRLPGPERPAGLPPGHCPGPAGLLRLTAYAAQPFIDHSNPDLTVMSFYEIPTPRASPLLRPHRPGVPGHRCRHSVTGRASYQFQNTSGQEQSISFGINPAIPSPM